MPLLYHCKIFSDDFLQHIEVLDLWCDRRTVCICIYTFITHLLPVLLLAAFFWNVLLFSHLLSCTK